MDGADEARRLILEAISLLSEAVDRLDRPVGRVLYLVRREPSPSEDAQDPKPHTRGGGARPCIRRPPGHHYAARRLWACWPSSSLRKGRGKPTWRPKRRGGAGHRLFDHAPYSPVATTSISFLLPRLPLARHDSAEDLPKRIRGRERAQELHLGGVGDGAGLGAGLGELDLEPQDLVLSGP